ncbi:hypothetical protein [Glycomyces rhizosphaerae]|uniref:SH3 domain-containing protein n=1 Tax=Glycomyces rhizosphaerae TaxID=2054422 RepID=A0ABV7Q795_9ACTN
MKKIIFAMAAIAAAVLLSLSSSATASAETTPVPTAPAGTSVSPTDVDVQQTCRARFEQAVNHRASPNTGSTRLGIVTANTWVPAACSRTAGGSYTACGTTSTYWVRVYWNGAWGYVAWSCILDWEYTS